MWRSAMAMATAMALMMILIVVFVSGDILEHRGVTADKTLDLGGDTMYAGDGQGDGAVSDVEAAFKSGLMSEAIVRIRAERFERETQAATGQTSGRWLVLLDRDVDESGAKSDRARRQIRLLERVALTLDDDGEIALNAAVVIDHGDEHLATLMERFGMRPEDSAMLLFHSRKLFRLSDARSRRARAAVDRDEHSDADEEREDGNRAQMEDQGAEDEDARIIMEWIKSTIDDPSRGAPVPAPPSLFATILKSLRAALGFAQRPLDDASAADDRDL